MLSKVQEWCNKQEMATKYKNESKLKNIRIWVDVTFSDTLQRIRWNHWRDLVRQLQTLESTALDVRSVTNIVGVITYS